MATPRKPIPSHARKVFQGILYTVWQWDQEMFDGSTQVFEALTRPDTSCVIATIGDQIILQQESQPNTDPFVTLPGGRCDEGEDGLMGAQPELLEETGLVSDDWTQLIRDPRRGTIQTTRYTFVARNCKKIQEPPPDPGEKFETSLISFEEFLALPDLENFRTDEVVVAILRARLDPTQREALRVAIFGA